MRVRYSFFSSFGFPSNSPSSLTPSLSGSSSSSMSSTSEYLEKPKFLMIYSSSFMVDRMGLVANLFLSFS